MQPPQYESPADRAAAIFDHDPPSPPIDIMTRYGARELDPATAERLENVVPRSTVYIPDTLLISDAVDRNEVLERLAIVGEPLGLSPSVVPDDGPRLFLQPAVVRLEASNDLPTRPADAWSVLQWARARFGLDALAGVGLDHLLLANPRVMAVPFEPQFRSQLDAQPVSQPAPDYVHQGGGGRQPVAWLGPPPPRNADVPGRRPVVAILDTGCGAHGWLDPVVQRHVTLDGAVLGRDLPMIDPEVAPSLDDFENAVAGHGTFMAGLVHMFCPDADILAVRVVDTDGVVVESDLARSLAQVFELVRRDREGLPGGYPVDIVVLSVGYYHETPEDGLFAPILAALFESLGRMGVVTVAAAGNDATSRPMYPAAFAPWSDGAGPFRVDSAGVPVVSVGAMNPDGVDALFSNLGPWVRAWETGASVVSTMPITYRRDANGPSRPTTFGRSRAGLDPEDYRTGFAVWSGTSFAAPVLAGKLATRLQAALGDARETHAAEEASRRARDAVKACTGIGA